MKTTNVIFLILITLVLVFPVMSARRVSDWLTSNQATTCSWDGAKCSNLKVDGDRLSFRVQIQSNDSVEQKIVKHIGFNSWPHGKEVYCETGLWGLTPKVGTGDVEVQDKQVLYIESRDCSVPEEGLFKGSFFVTTSERIVGEMNGITRNYFGSFEVYVVGEGNVRRGGLLVVLVCLIGLLAFNFKKVRTGWAESCKPGLVTGFRSLRTGGYRKYLKALIIGGIGGPILLITTGFLGLPFLDFVVTFPVILMGILLSLIPSEYIFGWDILLMPISYALFSVILYWAWRNKRNLGGRIRGFFEDRDYVFEAAIGKNNLWKLRITRNLRVGLVGLILLFWVIMLLISLRVPKDFVLAYGDGACHMEWGWTQIMLNGSSGEMAVVSAEKDPSKKSGLYKVSDGDVAAIYRSLVLNSILLPRDSYYDPFVKDGGCSGIEYTAGGKYRSISVSNRYIVPFEAISRAINRPQYRENIIVHDAETCQFFSDKCAEKAPSSEGEEDLCWAIDFKCKRGIYSR